MSDLATADSIRAWMQQVLRDHPELTGALWAKAANVAPSTVNRALKEDYPFVTSTRTLAKLAQAVNVPLPEVKRHHDIRIIPTFLAIRFKVQAGHWIEASDYVDELRVPDQAAVTPNPAFAEWKQWLEEVVGDSINKKIPDGGYAHVVDAIEMGYAPRDGDYVVVERRRDGGLLRERTIKQVVITREGVELWPRSTNPKWAEPLSLTAGSKPGEDLEVEVVGLVIGAYTPFV